MSDNPFEFSKEFASARIKMLVVASAILPFLLNIHFVDQDNFVTILGTKFTSDKMGVVFALWSGTLMYFWAVFFLRIIEEFTKFRSGNANLKSELSKVSDAKETMVEFGKTLRAFEQSFKRFNLEERFNDISAGGRLEVTSAEVQSASEAFSEAAKNFLKLPKSITNPHHDPDFSHETKKRFENCLAGFHSLPGDHDYILRDWKELVELYSDSLTAALKANETISGLKKIQRFRKAQSFAVSFRWLFFDAVAPWFFGVVVLIWTATQAYRKICLNY